MLINANTARYNNIFLTIQFEVMKFTIINNLVKTTIQYQLEEKLRSTMSRVYLHCHNCLSQDYDSIHIGIYPPRKCSIWGLEDVKYSFRSGDDSN